MAYNVLAVGAVRLLMTKYDTMTNKDFKEKYFAEKGIRWYDNWVDYANWLEDALIEALLQPPVSSECEHPYHSVLGDGEMQPAKCLKCGKVL